MNCCELCGQPIIEDHKVYELGRFRLDTGTRRATVDGEEIPLTPAEFVILETLIRRPGMRYSRDALLEQLGSDSDESLKSQVSVLRAKLKGVTIPDARKAGEHGHAGYMLVTAD